MDRRSVNILIIVAVAFGLIGFLVGQFVRVPSFRAFDGGGDERGFPGPKYAAVNPLDKTVTKSWLKVLPDPPYSNPFDAERYCPASAGWKIEVSLPFYLTYRATSLVHDKNIGTQAGPFVQDLHEVIRGPGNYYVYGYDYDYTVVTEGNMVFAVPGSTLFEKGYKFQKVRPFPKYEYYSPAGSVFEKESDLVGKLENGSEMQEIDSELLCSKPSSTGTSGSGE